MRTSLQVVIAQPAAPLQVVAETLDVLGHIELPRWVSWVGVPVVGVCSGS